MNRIRLIAILLLYAGYLLIGTFYPFEFSANRLPENLAGFFHWSSSKDFIENIMLFMPLGFLSYHWRVPDTKKASAILFAALVGGGFSLAIELAQAGSSHDPSAFDVIANIFGAVTGALLAALSPSRIRDLTCRSLAKLEKTGIFVCMAILLAAWPLVLSVVQT
jgi:glycopeptide antibiotics resistance protein